MEVPESAGEKDGSEVVLRHLSKRNLQTLRSSSQTPFSTFLSFRLKNLSGFTRRLDKQVMRLLVVS